MTLVWPVLLSVLAVATSFLAAGPLGRRTGWPLAAIYLAAAAGLAPAVGAVRDGRVESVAWDWVPTWGVRLALRADGLGLVFALIALLVGAVVLVYSTRYLAARSQLSFYLLMTLFTLSMLLLVLADDLVLLWLAWELTSLASFFLIARSGHAGEAGSMRTLLITFLGGLLLLAAVAAMVVRLGTTSLTEVLAAPVWREDPAFTSLVAALVLVAGMTKSAQFPFHTWLPDAMAAITPVSAYLHAAAVVKAGIFLLLRFSPAFHADPVWVYALVTAGLTTALLGGWFALQQTDLKRLMAYSTVSQLGLIVAAVGVGTGVAIAAAVVHTIAHALFKSGLFMMVGVVDHATHTRDLRRLPPLHRRMPGAFAVTVIGCASMAGLPPLLGFVSKESLLTALAEAGGPAWFGPAALVAGTAASVLTFAYCAKIALGGFVDGRDDRPVEPVPALMTVAAAVPIVAGLPLGLAVGVLDEPVARALDAARPGSGTHPHLALWHGVTPALVATLVVYLLGTLVTLRRRTVFRRLERPSLPFDGAAVIRVLHRGLARVGGRLGRATAPEHTARQLAPLVAVFATVLLGGVAALDLSHLPARTPGQDHPIDAVVLLLVCGAVVLACRSRSRVAATVSLSAVGILVTVQILALGAPDVGLTQLLVEALTVIVIMLVLQKLPRTFHRSPLSSSRVLTVALALAAGLAAGAGTFVLNGRRGPGEVSRYYVDQVPELSGGSNIVNVILVELRALDTMGELAVLGMTGIALVAILSTVRTVLLDPPDASDASEPDPADTGGGLRPPGSTAHRAITEAWSNVLPLQLMLRVMQPVLVLLSALIFWRGHHEPGGGFIAALVASAAIGLTYVSTSRDRQIGPPRLPVALIGGGIVLAVLTGGWGLVAAGSFLEPLHGSVGPVHLTSSMLFDVGVYLAVVGLITLTFNVLGTSAASTDHPGGEGTRERVDEAVEGELPGPLDTVRGERARVGLRTRFLSDNEPPRELGR